jgi:hypothetical protein
MVRHPSLCSLEEPVPVTKISNLFITPMIGKRKMLVASFRAYPFQLTFFFRISPPSQEDNLRDRRKRRFENNSTNQTLSSRLTNSATIPEPREADPVSIPISVIHTRHKSFSFEECPRLG